MIEESEDLPLAKQCCGNCKFAIKIADSKIAECHRRAPMVVVGQANFPYALGLHQLAAAWPQVDIKQDWCGDYQTDPRDPTEETEVVEDEDPTKP